MSFYCQNCCMTSLQVQILLPTLTHIQFNIVRCVVYTYIINEMRILLFSDRVILFIFLTPISKMCTIDILDFCKFLNYFVTFVYLVATFMCAPVCVCAASHRFFYLPQKADKNNNKNTKLE